jgi:hypothetical protein
LLLGLNPWHNTTEQGLQYASVLGSLGVCLRLCLSAELLAELQLHRLEGAHAASATTSAGHTTTASTTSTLERCVGLGSCATGARVGAADYRTDLAAGSFTTDEGRLWA